MPKASPCREWQTDKTSQAEERGRESQTRLNREPRHSTRVVGILLVVHPCKGTRQVLVHTFLFSQSRLDRLIPLNVVPRIHLRT
eukprot:COSAG02_NODE_5608_length_4191_cov_3.152493_3_plen_84_part_00